MMHDYEDTSKSSTAFEGSPLPAERVGRVCGFPPPPVGLATVIDVGASVENNVVHTASGIGLGVSSIDLNTGSEEKAVTKQMKSKKLESKDSDGQCMAKTDGQIANAGSMSDPEHVDHPGDWLTHTGKRRASSNKRPPTSRLAGGLSAAFTAKENPDEDTFQLDEELETSDRPNLKSHQPSSKRFVLMYLVRVVQSSEVNSMLWSDCFSSYMEFCYVYHLVVFALSLHSE